MAIHVAGLLAAAEGGAGSNLMSVDTTLFVATIVTFVVFAVILAKFAWGPLLQIVDEREKTIREQVDSAEKAAADAKATLAPAPGAAARRLARARRAPARARRRTPRRCAPSCRRRRAATPSRSWRAPASR
jgi:F-type H+-transporting ATPase subunit b